MTHLIQFPARPTAPPKRQYEIFTIEDNTLAVLGFRPGDEFVVAVGEFRPGHYHAFDNGPTVKVRRFFIRPPNLIGRVLPPHDAETVTSANQLS